MTSLDTSVLEVSSEVSNGNSEFKEGFDMTGIEVKYKCVANKSGRVKVSMLVTSDQCDPFTIFWYKSCQVEASLPSVNVSLTDKGGEIIKEGKFVLNEFKEVSQEHIIPSSSPTFTLYISSSKPELKYTLSEPQIILNEENLVPIFQGQLRKGGEINNTPQSLILAMACTSLKQSKTDIQIKLKCDNNQRISLFFNKECDTTEEITAYFSILTFIYWIFLILISIFLVILFFYYLKRNDMTVFDLFDKIKEFCRENIYNKYLSSNRKGTSKNNELSSQRENQNEKLFEEDHLDVKITSSKEDRLDREGDKDFNLEERNKNVIKMDYGGI